MSQSKIKKEAEKLSEELRLFDKKVEKEREEIIDRIRENQRKCLHPNKQGNREWYCPDCKASD